MMLSAKKQLWSLARIILPCMGFALTCSGAYLVSLQTEFGYSWKVLPAYIMIVVGFLAVFIGVFWNICHSMRSKMYQRRDRRQQQHIQVYTIERPSSFPPSYEESQSSQASDADPEFVVVVDEVDRVDVGMSLAPPLYSQDSLEAPDCTWSWEQPPRYSQVECIQHGESCAEEQRQAVSEQ